MKKTANDANMYMLVAKEISPRRTRAAKEREQIDVIRGPLNLVSLIDLQIMCLRLMGFSPAYIIDAISTIAMVLKRSKKLRVPINRTHMKRSIGETFSNKYPILVSLS